MPLSELFRLATRQLESSQKKACPRENSARGGNDLVELVWENGQIKMQSQSSRATRSPVLTSSVNRVPDAGTGHGPATRIGKFGGVQSILDDTFPVVPLGGLDLRQDDEMVPWLRSSPTGNALAQDYGSELLTGMSGITANGLSMQNSFASVDKRSSTCDQAVKKLQSSGNGNSLKVSTSSTSHMLYSRPSLHCQTSDAVGSGSVDIISGNNASTKVEMPKNVRVPTNNSNFLNFSHFSTPAALVRSKLLASDGIPAPVSSGVERVEVKETGSSACAKNVVQSGLSASPAKLAMVDSRQLSIQASEEPSPPERTENVCKEIKHSTAEPVAAFSSVCSGNGANREKMHCSKRKFWDVEDSECRSDDFETESTGVTKPGPARGGFGSKRSRAAEVHNLSERRRRDRINEKMRALQELIPNCSRVDKASMLDEAIEYLKTLQLQVQIMSMGAGLCMPPMMFPTGMQHMRPHFWPMGVGMGFGMGMAEMNARAPGCHILPVPPMQQTGCFPSPMSGLNNFQRVPAPSLPVYGHLDQGICSSVLRPPSVPLTGDSAMGLSSFRDESRNEVPSASPTLSCGDPMKNKDLDSRLDAGVSTSSADRESTKVCSHSPAI